METLAETAEPVPDKPTVWGLPEALSETVSVAARSPLVDGAKMTTMVQLLPAASEAPQLLVWVKLPALAPDTVRPVTFNAALPELVSVTDWGTALLPTSWLGKLKLLGERLAAAAAPVPERLTIWGLPLALSATASEAVAAPAVAGVNMIEIVHWVPAATEELHVLVWVKSVALAPVKAILVMLRAALPTLFTVTT